MGMKKKPARKAAKKVATRKPNEAKAKKKLKAAKAKRARSTVSTSGGQVIERGKELLSGVQAPTPAPSAPVIMGVDEKTFEAEIAKRIESKAFMGRYIVEAPSGDREISRPTISVLKQASYDYNCTADGVSIPRGGQYTRIEYMTARSASVRERACPGCTNAMLMVAAKTGKMPMPSDLMKSLKHLAVQHESPIWEAEIQKMNNRYVGNAVDIRVFPYEVEAALKASLLSPGDAPVEHLPEQG